MLIECEPDGEMRIVENCRDLFQMIEKRKGLTLLKVVLPTMEGQSGAKASD